jgi:hypothetical protein
MQSCQGSVVKEEISGSTNCSRKDVLFEFHISAVLCSSASRQNRRKDGNSIRPKINGRSKQSPAYKKQTPAGIRPVSSGSQFEQSASGQHIQNSFCSTSGYDKLSSAVLLEAKILAITKLYST